MNTKTLVKGGDAHSKKKGGAAHTHKKKGGMKKKGGATRKTKGGSSWLTNLGVPAILVAAKRTLHGRSVPA